MKKLSLLLIASLITFTLFSQRIDVQTKTKKINKDKHTVAFVVIPHTDDKTVEKEWKRLMKDYDAEDVKRRKEVFADNVLIPKITDNTIDIYAKAEEKNENVEFYVAVDLGGIFLDESNEEQLNTLKSIVKKFAVSIASEAYEDILDDQKDVVEDINKEIEDLTDDKEHLKKKNEKYREKIEENDEEKEELSKEMEDQTKKLKEEQKKLEKLKKEVSKIKD